MSCEKFKELMKSPMPYWARAGGFLLCILGALYFLDLLITDFPTVWTYLDKFLESEVFFSFDVKDLLLLMIYSLSILVCLWGMPESKFLESKTLCEIADNTEEDYANLKRDLSKTKNKNRMTQFKLLSPLILLVGVTFQQHNALGICFLVSFAVAAILRQEWFNKVLLFIAVIAIFAILVLVALLVVIINF